MDDDIIINVSKWMRENQRLEPDLHSNERECLAYLGMMMYKIFLIGETSHKWSNSFKKMMKQFPKELKELVR